MVEAVVFVGAIIAGVTEFIKNLSPQIQGAVTVAVAVAVGIVVALVDVQMGIENISIAQGIMIGLASAGVVGTAKKIG